MGEPADSNKDDVLLNTALVGDIDENKICRLGGKFYLRVWLSGGEGVAYAVDYVDVMACCVSAEILPPRKRLTLPPKRGEVVEFSVRPKRAGKAEVEILLLIRGERIHKSRFVFICE